MNIIIQYTRLRVVYPRRPTYEYNQYEIARCCHGNEIDSSNENFVHLDRQDDSCSSSLVHTLLFITYQIPYTLINKSYMYKIRFFGFVHQTKKTQGLFCNSIRMDTLVPQRTNNRPIHRGHFCPEELISLKLLIHVYQISLKKERLGFYSTC